MSLSGGQRQRLALARAVLAQPKVLVLDDTLSALDIHTEKLVEEALQRVLASTTGLVVAHRASTVLLADRVALLQDGTITHVGDHRHLLATVPAYRELLAADAEELEEQCMRHPTTFFVSSAALPPNNAAGPRMTTTQTPPAEQVPEGQEWRGVAADGRDDLTAETTARLADRSRRLLKDLLTPYRSEVKLLGVAVVIENAARLSIPLLVALGIDKGIPPIQQDNDLRAAVRDRRDRAGRHPDPGGRAQHLPGPLGADRPGHPLRDPAARSSASSSASARRSTTPTRRVA